MYQTICFLGGESFALGFAFSSRHRLIIRRALVSGFGLAKSTTELRKWPTR